MKYQWTHFPRLVSYNRFVELPQGSLVSLCCFLTNRFGRCSGISFIDSTRISVCHNQRIWSHKVMAELAARGKTSVGWFYGFKLHRLSMTMENCWE
nr:transposase [Nitrosomonas communis]